MSAKARLARAMRNPRVLRRGLAREAASVLQRGQLQMDEFRATQLAGRGTGRRVFSLDVHQSVIADLAKGMPEVGLEPTRWCLSFHNFVNRKIQIAPDPVRVVNAGSWKSLDENMIDAFQDRYRKFLLSFDGFVVCYPFAFAELYRGLDRPILAVGATRYEVPYTLQPTQWRRLNCYLTELDGQGMLVLAANNKGDRDYIEYFTGFRPSLVPSVCDYTEARWTPIRKQKLVLSRIPELLKPLLDDPASNWVSARSALNERFRWKDMFSFEEVFVVPYNISTMTLFELATAGVPVTVPSKRLLKQWVQEGFDVLSELSFYQVLGADPTNLSSDNPNNVHSHEFLDWWISRGDFYDSELMPNVRCVDSLEQASREPHFATTRSHGAWMRLVDVRNTVVSQTRKGILAEFARVL